LWNTRWNYLLIKSKSHGLTSLCTSHIMTKSYLSCCRFNAITVLIFRWNRSITSYQSWISDRGLIAKLNWYSWVGMGYMRNRLSWLHLFRNINVIINRHLLVFLFIILCLLNKIMKIYLNRRDRNRNWIKKIYVKE
jgi:hypothetical protein